MSDLLSTMHFVYVYIFILSSCPLHHVAHVLADVVRHVGAVHVVPEEVPGPGEQRVVELQHGHAVLALEF